MQILIFGLAIYSRLLDLMLMIGIPGQTCFRAHKTNPKTLTFIDNKKGRNFSQFLTKIAE